MKRKEREGGKENGWPATACNETKKWPIYSPVYPSLFFHGFLPQSHTLRDTASALELGPFPWKKGRIRAKQLGKH